MTTEEKLIALQGCVFTPNCCVTAFQASEWGETVRLILANGLVIEAKTDDLTISQLP